MHMDGRITAKVIKHLTNKNIPILSIHDSYITQNQHTGELRKVMNKVVTDEVRQRELLQEDEEEDFLDEAIVNPEGN